MDLSLANLLSAQDTGPLANTVFLHPGWFWLLPGLASLALLLRITGRANRSLAWPGRGTGTGPGLRHPLLYLLGATDDTAHSTGSARARWRTLFTWAILACLVTALAQPVRIGQRLPAPPSERSIVLIIDSSVAMVLRDYLLDGQRVSRLHMLKAVLSRFVDGLHGDRVSLIVFADTAHVMLPLTRDHHLVQQMLARIRTGIAGRASAPGDALTLAIARAQGDKAHRRILVLFTGVDIPSGTVPPLDAAALAARAGLPVYTVAIGAGDTAAEEKRTTGLIYHPVNLALLQRIAALTGARSYQAGAPGMLQKALRDISQREAEQHVVEQRHTHTPLYYWPLLAALTLWILARLSLPLWSRVRWGAGRRRRA